MKFSTTLILLAALTAGCSTTSITRSGTTPVNDDFTVGGANWRGDGVTIVLMKLRENQGMLELCGAITTDGSAQIRSLEVDVARFSYVEVNGKSIVSSVTYFNRFGYEEDAPVANCAITDTPWSPTFEDAEPVFKLGETTFVL